MPICPSVIQTDRTANNQRGDQNASPEAFLSENAYCCEFHDGAVILDLNRNAYIGIDAQQLHNLRTHVANWPRSIQGGAAHPGDVAASAGLIGELLARGILTTARTAAPSAARESPAKALTIASMSKPRTWIPIGHMAHFVVALMIVALRLWRNELPSLLKWLRLHQSSIRRARAVTLEDAQGRLASFLWLRTWFYTAQRRCLFDSLVLSIYLTKGQVPCTFVIGVATKPFLAHAWVQMGGSVLNDTAEHAQEFKPILSVDGG